VIAGLRSLDFLVVCDFFLSETAAEADLVLRSHAGLLSIREVRTLLKRSAPTRQL
jgi:assimilatory nitrate reductase catalytic subunit